MANISKVYLLSTPLEDDMKNTLYFAGLVISTMYLDEPVVPAG